MKRTLWVATIVFSTAATLAAQSNTGHPDLSGTWLFSIDLPPIALKRSTSGTTTIKTIDASGRRPASEKIAGAMPYADAPAYKPELRAKVKALLDHESKTDPVFYCDRPGVPRIGPPRRIIQLPNEFVFLYEDISGDPYRLIPVGGTHKKDGNPSYYGDSVARWDGNTLVVDVVNFVDSTWFGEDGYYHSDAMHVTERFWRSGSNLVYQVTVEDPKVLTAPWTMAPRVVKPSTEALEESPKCTETDSKLLVNNDHHGQR
ncbi:MAG TPA: hypothetical protein VLV86_09560 [Vicinamibacterales bacterium]|nr:hypothetical protein [Vicinamibacterales bacterium]